MTSTYTAYQLQTFAAAMFEAVGVPGDQAALIADNLVQADLRGHGSHGLLRVPWYVKKIQNGVVRAVSEPQTVVDAGAIAVVDGQDGMGQVVGTFAARQAIARAKEHGVGVVAVRNSGHFGTVQYYTLMGPPEGCVMLVMTNASPAMAPWGGRKKSVGNNPWSVAAPAGHYAPVVLDIANTVVARGKIFLAKQKGNAVPPGWAMDSEGRPTTDAEQALAGIIMPMGEHKGYAIAFAVDLLAGVLSGAEFSGKVNGPYQADKRSGAGHLMIALEIKRFQPLAQFEAKVEEMISYVKSVPLAAGVTEIFYPGEIEARNEASNRQQGIKLASGTVSELKELALELGVHFTL